MLIGEIQKDSTEKIRVTLSEYKGYKFIDVRFTMTMPKSGDL